MPAVPPPARRTPPGGDDPTAQAAASGWAEAVRRIALAARLNARRLDLQGLGLAALPPLPPGWAGPRRLDLSDNVLDAWPDGLQGWTALEWLDLSGNQLERLGPDIGALTGLQDLRLQGNHLHELPDALAACTALARLDLRDNRFDRRPEVLDRLPALQQLLLDGLAPTGADARHAAAEAAAASIREMWAAPAPTRTRRTRPRREREGPTSFSAPPAWTGAPSDDAPTAGAEPPDADDAPAIAPSAAPAVDPAAAAPDEPTAAAAPANPLPAADRLANPRGDVPRPPEAEPVDCSVFAPPQVPAGQAFLLQAFVHPGTDAGADAARAQAQEADASATRRAGAALPMDVARGSTIDLHLEWPGLQVDEPDARLVWRGRTQAATFEVRVPPGTAPQPAIGRLRLAVDGVPAGVLRFQVLVVPASMPATTGRTATTPPAAGTGCHAPPPDRAQPLDAQPTRYRRAFVSYSSKDRGEVLRRVQAFRIAGLQVWQDVLDLDPGERWQRGLWDAIDQCDVFLLFWSDAARQSEWVGKEIARALARKGGRADADAPPAIQPVPIQGPPIPLPPPELGMLHFNDALLAHIAVNPPH